jgi:NOL1/NOP2/fmu family ribosome biogenesis protein
LRAEMPSTDPSVASVIEEVTQRFGINPNIFSGYCAQATNHRGMYLYPACLQIPEKLPIDAAGLFSIKTKVKHAKLSTPAAMWITPHAKSNCIELTTAQRDLYLLRQDSLLSDEQVQQLTSTGYVLVAYQGIGLGIGLYLEYTEGPAKLESLFPKSL